mgnify:CR=1 FL=1
MDGGVGADFFANAYNEAYGILAGNGYIYGVEALQLSSTTTTGPGTGVSGGRLIRWRHVGMSDGSFEWEGPIVMDTFWS